MSLSDRGCGKVTRWRGGCEQPARTPPRSQRLRASQKTGGVDSGYELSQISGVAGGGRSGAITLRRRPLPQSRVGGAECTNTVRSPFSGAPTFFRWGTSPRSVRRQVDGRIR